MLLRVNPRQMKITQTLPIGDAGDHPASPDELTAGASSLWVMGRKGVVAEINPNTRRVLRRIDVGGQGAVSFGAGSLWVARQTDGRVLKLAPETGRFETIDVGARAVSVAVRAPLAWVTASRRTGAGRFEGRVVRIDTRTGRLVGQSLPLGAFPGELAVTPRDVWIADATDATVTRVVYRP